MFTRSSTLCAGLPSRKSSSGWALTAGQGFQLAGGEAHAQRRLVAPCHDGVRGCLLWLPVPLARSVLLCIQLCLPQFQLPVPVTCRPSSQKAALCP